MALDVDRIAEAVVEGASALVRKEAAKLNARIAELEARLAQVESKNMGSLVFRGVWQASQEYTKGAMVTHRGGLWHANRGTDEVPGTGSGWTLAVKSGERQ